MTKKKRVVKAWAIVYGDNVWAVGIWKAGLELSPQMMIGGTRVIPCTVTYTLTQKQRGKA